jgi:hypothetical protein
MERRDALKNLGKAFGFAVATPTVLSILQSCSSSDGLSWAPQFFSSEEGSFLVKAIDVILPATDTPSASEVNVHVFIDKLIAECYDEGGQKWVRNLMSAFTTYVTEASGATSLGAISEANLVDSFTILFGERDESIPSEAYDFAGNLRNMTISAYRGSEYIGENVLAYLPVPGEYVACDDLQTLTGGKAWSE